ncbi:hypothetical protein [Acidibrevibacterium fodinaquatile]|uniref:hypothetical protein n=1 Tax=Acidibrevibacterium fodinaquatile TaxID=1969806 RepID=UPI00196696FF|nr:hypothetical protein [Acidibrevibacterium fodinaquatile]
MAFDGGQWDAAGFAAFRHVGGYARFIAALSAGGRGSRHGGPRRRTGAIGCRLPTAGLGSDALARSLTAAIATARAGAMDGEP